MVPAEVISWSHFNQRLESLIIIIIIIIIMWGGGGLSLQEISLSEIYIYKEKERRGYNTNCNRNNIHKQHVDSFKYEKSFIIKCNEKIKVKLFYMQY